MMTGTGRVSYTQQMVRLRAVIDIVEAETVRVTRNDVRFTATVNRIFVGKRDATQHKAVSTRQRVLESDINVFRDSFFGFPQEYREALNFHSSSVTEELVQGMFGTEPWEDADSVCLRTLPAFHHQYATKLSSKIRWAVTLSLVFQQS